MSITPQSLLSSLFLTWYLLHVIARSIHARPRSACSTHLSSLQQLVAQKKVGCDTRAGGDAVSEDSVGVKDAGQLRVHGLSGLKVQANHGAISVLILHIRNYNTISHCSCLNKRQALTSILNVKTGVGSQGLGDNKESIGESLNSPLGLALD